MCSRTRRDTPASLYIRNEDRAAAGAAGDAASSAEVGGAGTSYKYQGEDWRNVGTRDTCTLLGHHWGHILSKNTQNSSLDYEELLEQV